MGGDSDDDLRMVVEALAGLNGDTKKERRKHGRAGGGSDNVVAFGAGGGEDNVEFLDGVSATSRSIIEGTPDGGARGRHWRSYRGRGGTPEIP